MSDKPAACASPYEVARGSHHGMDGALDSADQADRLTMIMEAEATHNALNGGGGEGSIDELPYPLEDTEDLLAREDAEDASDDPMHAGGLDPAPWITAEQAAIHVFDPDRPEEGGYVDDENDGDRDNPELDRFDSASAELTPEDETLLGVDPYPGRAPGR